MTPFDRQELLSGFFANDGSLKVSDQDLAAALLRARVGKAGRPDPDACDAVQAVLVDLEEIRHGQSDNQSDLLRAKLGEFLGIDVSVIVDGASQGLSNTSFNCRLAETEGYGYLDYLRQTGKFGLVGLLLETSDKTLRHGRPQLAFAACTELLKVRPAELGRDAAAACYEQTIQLAQPVFANTLGTGVVPLLTSMVQNTIIDTPPHHAAVSALVNRLFAPRLSADVFPNALLALVTHTAKGSPENELGPILFEGPVDIPSASAKACLQAIRLAYEMRTGMRQASAPVKEKLSTRPN